MEQRPKKLFDRDTESIRLIVIIKEGAYCIVPLRLEIASLALAMTIREICAFLLVELVSIGGGFLFFLLLIECEIFVLIYINHDDVTFLKNPFQYIGC